MVGAAVGAAVVGAAEVGEAVGVNVVGTAVGALVGDLVYPRASAQHRTDAGVVAGVHSTGIVARLDDLPAIV